MNKLSLELINYIEEFKPKHPLEDEIKHWRGPKDKPRCYFYEYYFEWSIKIIERKKKRKYLEDHKEYLFKTLLEDGYTNEEIVRLNYKSKLEKIRLSKKLEELNIKSYEIKTVEHFPRLNKHGNFREIYFKDREIIF